MSLIHIKETFNDDGSTTIRVDGRLDSSSIPVLEKVCQCHLDKNCKVYVEVDGLSHISREGRGFLLRMRDKVTLEKVPQFIRLEY